MVYTNTHRKTIKYSNLNDSNLFSFMDFYVLKCKNNVTILVENVKRRVDVYEETVPIAANK